MFCQFKLSMGAIAPESSPLARRKASKANRKRPYRIFNTITFYALRSKARADKAETAETKDREGAGVCTSTGIGDPLGWMAEP
jgi:hypothetical protein